MTAAVEELEETAATSAAAPAYDFDDSFQAKIVALTMRDTGFLKRTDGLILPNYFENEVDAALINVAADFYKTYKKAPELGLLSMLIKDAVAAKRIRKDLLPGLQARLRVIMTTSLADRAFVIDRVATFAKMRAAEEAILQSVNALAKGDFDKIRKLMQTALDVGAAEDDQEYDYFKEIDNRTAHRVAIAAGTIKPDGITTGFPDLDKHLYHHGWGRGELQALMAPAKFGKSMGLGEFSKSAAVAGHPTLTLTCENSARIYADRLDANFADTAMRLLGDRPFDVMAKIKAAQAKSAPLIIRSYPSGTLKPSQVRRVLEKYRQDGLIFDLIVIDYADIMCPEHMSGEFRHDSNSIWLDIRAIAHQENAAVLTATQTNREGAKAMTSKATDVAEDFNKIRNADLIISGNATVDEIAANEARLYFAASRNQEGGFSLRIQQDRAKMKFLTKVLGIER